MNQYKYIIKLKELLNDIIVIIKKIYDKSFVFYSSDYKDAKDDKNIFMILLNYITYML